MNYLLAADFHGNVDAYLELKRVADVVRPDEIVLLGDLFDANGAYPVNNVLDRIFFPILAVRGNCDYDDVYKTLNAGLKGVSFYEGKDDKRIFFTHGHLYDRGCPPTTLGKGDVMFYGHFHVPEIAKNGRGVWSVCVGSAGKPGAGSRPTYGLFDGEIVRICDLYTDETVLETELWK